MNLTIIEQTPLYVVVCHPLGYSRDVIIETLFEFPLIRGNFLALEYKFSRICLRHRVPPLFTHSYFYDTECPAHLIGKSLTDNQYHETNARP